MSSAALILPPVSLSHNRSATVKSRFSGPTQFDGCRVSPEIVSYISSRRTICPLHAISFVYGSISFGACFSRNRRAGKVRVGIRDKSSSSSGTWKSNSGREFLRALKSSEAKSAVIVVRDEEAPYPEGRDGEQDSIPAMDVTTDTGQGVKLASKGEESSIGKVEETVSSVTRQSKMAEVSGKDPSLPTMEDIVATAALQGIKLQVKSFGPSFEIIVTSLDETKMYGKADGWIKWWTKGKILHLESVKLERSLSKQVGNVFGAGIFVGASTLRYGLDRGCQTAELLAIYDDEITHGKLVKYYNRLGFKTLYEVNEEDLKYFPDRVVWGGVGTRMDADCEELLRKWAVILKPRAKTGSRSKNKKSSSTTEVL